MGKSNYTRIKIHRNYTMEELAGVLGVHKNTVLGWVKNGLPCLKDRRPFLIVGREAKAYLHAKRDSMKRRCKLHELYCMRCKKPVEPMNGQVEYHSNSSGKGRLQGKCQHCGATINKFISNAHLETYLEVFQVVVPKGLEHIKDSMRTFLNRDFKEKGSQS